MGILGLWILHGLIWTKATLVDIFSLWNGLKFLSVSMTFFLDDRKVPISSSWVNGDDFYFPTIHVWKLHP